LSKEDFRWGPIARGLYTGLIWATVVIGFTYPFWLVHYLALLLFLGFALRPLLAGSGLYAIYGNIVEAFGAWRWRKRIAKRRQEIASKQRDAPYRHKRVKDPRLPKNW